MPRVTQALKLEHENEEQAVAFFRDALHTLPDPRRAQGIRYPFESVIVIALMAMVCGSDDAEAMESWGEANRQWLADFLDLPHGTPTQDVFLAVFAALNPEAFGSVFRAWAQLLAARLQVQGKHIAVDGKSSRRSFDPANGQPPLHMVNAWLTDAGLVLGQKKTDDQSNEITAIPELLRVLDIQGATVSIDAIGCQTEIARTIVEGGADYLLAVKTNQPRLHQDLLATFAQAADTRRRSQDELQRPSVETFEEVDKGHGRLEKRRVVLCRDLSFCTEPERWPKLAFLAEITRERTVLTTQKTSNETVYYIGSRARTSAHDAAMAVRNHWGIETELHWVLDMAFREDEARHRARNTAQNMTTLRHFAINIIKQDKKRQLGVANCRKRAGWDRSYLIALLTGSVEQR